MTKQVNYNENHVAGAAIRDDKGRRISKLFEAPHPKMTVGYAKNLIMPNDPTEQEFDFRQAGGGVIEDGVAVIDKVKGNSVVWNQRIEVKGNFTVNGVHFEKNGNSIKVYTDTGGATNTATITETLSGKQWSEVAIVGHKYAMSGCPNGGSRDSFYMSCYSSNSWQGEKFDTGNGVVFSVTENVSNGYPRMAVAKGTIITTPIYFQPQLIDLTLMFGAGNEPTTYEEFLQRKPFVEDEFAYNEGTIVNNKVEKVVTTGRNLCPYLEQGTLNIYNGSEQPSTTRVRTPFIPISNKHSYCTMLNKWSIRNGCFYDRNKNFISSGFPSVSTGVMDSSTIPANAAFYRLIYSAQNSSDVVTPSYDVFMFAVGNTTIPTTKYEPYEEHTLDLAWVKDIKDGEGVKLFENGLAKGDFVTATHASKGSCKRILTGNESWTDFISDYHCVVLNLESPNDYIRPDSFGISNKVTMPIKTANSEGNGIQFGYSDEHFESYFTTLQEWKDYLASQYSSGNPVEVYYELAKPIEVEYDEKNLTYPVVAGGTEEAVASEPSSAFRADIGYGIDAVKTILDLKARVKALEGK